MKSFQQSLPMMLHRTLDAVLPEFRVIFSRFDLTEQQWRVLRSLWEQDGLTLLDLASATLIPGPSLVGVVDRLERNGLVVRKRSTEDRRKVHVYTTERGSNLENEVQPLVDQVTARLEACLQPERWQAMMQALDDLVVEIQTEGVDTNKDG